MRSTTGKKFFGFFGFYNKQILPDKKWFVCYYTPDYITGKLKKNKYYGEINKYLTIDERLAECERIKLLILDNKELPNFRGARRMQPKQIKRNFASVVELMRDALNQRKYEIDALTLSGYNSMIVSFELWLTSSGLNDVTIGAFDETMARAFLFHLKKNGCANKTHNNYKVILGSLWEVIARKLKSEIKIENYWKEIKSLKKNTKPYRAYNAELETMICNELPNFDNQLWLFVQLTHYCFIRGSENRYLKIENIDLYNRIITIPADIAKTKKQRTVVIPNDLYNYLISLNLEQFANDAYLFSIKGFPSAQSVSVNHFRNKWNKFKKLKSIPKDYKLYAWKHTGFIKSLQNGVSLKEIQLQAGHHSLDQVDEYLASMNVQSIENLRNSFPKIGTQSSIETNNVQVMFEEILKRLKTN